VEIGYGGDSTNAAFGTAFDFTLACSGTQRYKDPGPAGTVVALGIGPATIAPVVKPQEYCIAFIGDVATNYTAIYGGYTPHSGAYMYVVADNQGRICFQTYFASPTPVDTTVLNGPQGTGIGQPTDTFNMTGIIVGNPNGVSIEIDILLIGGDSGGDQVSDYFSYLINDISTLNPDPITGFFNLVVQRQNFIRVGNNLALGWNTTFGFRISVQAAPSQVMVFMGSDGNTTLTSTTSILNIYGGSLVLNGVYQFAQVNVNVTSSYEALSPLGPPTNNITINNASPQFIFQTPTDPQVNQVWVYARAAPGMNAYGIASSLNGWFRVAVITNFTYLEIYIMQSDEDTLELDIAYNTSLITIASVPGGVQTKIFDIIGPVNGRWYYFTTNFMYPSDINDPDLVNVTLGVRTCGSSSELFMWARNVAPGTILVGTSCEIYMLTGTFNTLADGSIDVTYLPMGCHFPPITNDCITYSGNVYYLASDGWRSFSYMGINPYNNFGNAQNTFGFNPVLVSPNTDRLYRGDTCYGYAAPNLVFEPGSVRFPIAMAQNKLWCFIHGCQRGEVYDFLRQYWRPLVLSSSDATAAFTCQDGSLIVSFANSLYQINNRTTLAPNISLLTPVMDNGTPEQRKDCYTFKIRCLATGYLTISLIDETGTSYEVATGFSSYALTYTCFDISSIMADGLAKTFQVSISGTVTAFVFDDISITFDTRPLQTTFLRFQGVNYGTVSRKRLYSVPFQIDTLGWDVVLTPYVDGVAQTALTVNSTRKQSFHYEFPLLGSDDVLKGSDYEWTFATDSFHVFEFWGWEQPKNIEILPEQRISHFLPVTNFGTAARKRVRTWPFVLDPVGGDVTFTPIVDGVAGTSLEVTGTGKETFRYYFDTDVNGVDYNGVFSSTTPFEFYEMGQPEMVQVLPVEKQLDKLGPYDMFKYGKVKEIEVRLSIIGDGTVIPYSIFFNDGQTLNGSLIVLPQIEASYFIPVPKGTSGEVFSMVLGPVTGFTFCRYYVRIKCASSGRDTENQWVLLPEPVPQAQGGQQ
jgi:hypothetical protein